jgi:hypothetical protein
MKWLLGLREELARLCWDEDPLRARRKGHRTKVRLARRLYWAKLGENSTGVWTAAS